MAAAHALGVLANWMVQLALDIYRSIQNSLTVRTKEGRPAGMDCKELKRLARRTAGNTLKGSASLILASFGAGLGTVLIRPSTGTWIGMFPTITNTTSFMLSSNIKYTFILQWTPSLPIDHIPSLMENITFKFAMSVDGQKVLSLCTCAT